MWNWICVIGFALQLCIAGGLPASETYEILIKGGRIVDGTGAPWYVADIAIGNGAIARIGTIEGSEAERVIEAAGLTVAPGFIDMMGQTATPMLDDPGTALNLLSQGITTINAGEGVSAAPLSDEEASSRGWETMAEYFQVLDLAGLPVNVVQTVGHTQVRRLAIGERDREPSEAELAHMKALVREAMQAGAIGVSTALIYPPAVYADTTEIAALAEVAGTFGGRYYTHMRNEGDRLLEAIDEALEIGRKGKTPVHIFHLKAAGRRNWNKMEVAIAKIKEARSSGQQVTADIYPYINNGLGIDALIHPRHFAQGREPFLQRLDDPDFRAQMRQELESESDDWENWFQHVGRDWHKIIVGRTHSLRFENSTGKSIQAIAEDLNSDPWEVFFDLVRVEAFVLPESMTEANKRRLLQEAFVSFCTDVGPAGGASSTSHPRAFGSFPRLFSRYVRDGNAISLERAIAQATAVAANDIFAYDRGRIAEGLAADLVVMEYEKLADRADFAAPDQLSEGVKYVIVNGVLVFEDGDLTGARPGRVLRGPGYQFDRAPHAISSGPERPELAAIDRAMRSFMERHGVPGAALAITDQGRLVYARGFGYADIAAQAKVQPKNLFRIASLSKPITAVAILQLVEKEMLELDEKVFDILDYAPIDDESSIEERLKAITIRHLLEHRGGWDRDVSFDAMFQPVRFAKALDSPPPAGRDGIIRNMLSQPLDFDPGERYAYSNFGYCLLGRVIEKRTGESYEAYVKAHVLDPIGAKDMIIGRTLADQRSPGEVRYYTPNRVPSVFAENLGQRVPEPYGGWYLEAMDSHGGWIASVIDLARFAAALDEPEGSPLLDSASIAAMFARPEGLAGYDGEGNPKNGYYSLGWRNDVVEKGPLKGGVIRSHSRSLDGTAALLIKRPDGRNWVVLFNARRSPLTSHFGSAIERTLNSTIDGIEEWPEVDLFKSG